MHAVCRVYRMVSLIVVSSVHQAPAPAVVTHSHLRSIILHTALCYSLVRTLSFHVVIIIVKHRWIVFPHGETTNSHGTYEMKSGQRLAHINKKG